MASLLSLNLDSPLKAQAEVLREEVAQRSQYVAGLEQVQSRFASFLTEIEMSNQGSAELLKQLKSSNPSSAQQNSEDSTEVNKLETLTKLVHFLMELKKAESLEKLYPKISSLKNEARKVEAEAVKLDTEVHSLKEIIAQMRLLLTKKRETIKLLQESKSKITDLASKV